MVDGSYVICASDKCASLSNTKEGVRVWCAVVQGPSLLTAGQSGGQSVRGTPVVESVQESTGPGKPTP